MALGIDDNLFACWDFGQPAEDVCEGNRDRSVDVVPVILSERAYVDEYCSLVIKKVFRLQRSDGTSR